MPLARSIVLRSFRSLSGSLTTNGVSGEIVATTLLLVWQFRMLRFLVGEPKGKSNALASGWSQLQLSEINFTTTKLL